LARSKSLGLPRALDLEDLTSEVIARLFLKGSAALPVDNDVLPYCLGIIRRLGRKRVQQAKKREPIDDGTLNVRADVPTAMAEVKDLFTAICVRLTHKDLFFLEELLGPSMPPRSRDAAAEVAISPAATRKRKSRLLKRVLKILGDLREREREREREGGRETRCTLKLLLRWARAKSCRNATRETECLLRRVCAIAGGGASKNRVEARPAIARKMQVSFSKTCLVGDACGSCREAALSRGGPGGSPGSVGAKRCADAVLDGTLTVSSTGGPGRAPQVSGRLSLSFREARTIFSISFSTAIWTSGSLRIVS
jgi:hypothetical protein